jgi:hypothetical protein
LGIGLTLQPFGYYNTGRFILNAPGNIINGIRHYNLFKGALETIGRSQIIPQIIAEEAYY